jgi:hypothetical protein
MTGNTASSRRSNELASRHHPEDFGANENNSASDSEKPWTANEGEARQLGMAVKRAGIARSASTRESSARTIRRRSPGSSDATGDSGAMLPPVRRIRESSILSPTVASITKAMGATAIRRTTVGEAGGLQKAAVRSASGGRPSIVPGSIQRPSMAGAGYKGWRA